MRLPGASPVSPSIFSILLFSPLLAAAYGNFDCGRVVLDNGNAKYDFHELGGARAVMHGFDNTQSWKNTTYTLDLCRPLGKARNRPKGEQCPNKTRVCAAVHTISKDDPPVDTLEKVFPVAGELIENKGGNLDAKWQLFRDSKSASESAKDGVILEMFGGVRFDDGVKKNQKVVIEFLCDKNRTGLENLPNPNYEENLASPPPRRTIAKPEEGEKEPELDGEPSLKYLRYDREGKDVDTLRLEWRTKYACSPEDTPSHHWGFFTWFIIIAFMSTAAYLIFGSWLNYNRYGARGWDLLPHGDTIRDVPYLLKDWFRRVLNTIQGGGSRGGYAAV